MNKLRTILIGAALAVLYALPLFTLRGLGAAYIKFDGVDGESTDKGHGGWIDLLSFGWGAKDPGGGGTKEIDDFSITYEMEKASPRLALACLKGEVFPKVEISVTQPGSTGIPLQYLYIEFTDALVTSVAHEGLAAGGDKPTESVSFNFTKIAMKYTEYQNDQAVGETEFKWDVLEGKEL